MRPEGTGGERIVRSVEETPPWWVVVPVLALGVVLVGGITFGGHLVGNASERRQPSPQGTPNDLPPTTLGPSAEPIPSADWWTLLRGADCPVPCVGGTACSLKPTRCTSGFTCVPGSGVELLDAPETWMLHLSAVQERAPDGSRLDPCVTGRDFWVCQAGTSNCIAQKDACSNAVAAATSGAALPITGAEIASGTFVLDVRDGGVVGPVVATTRPIRRLQRSGLCRGYAIGATGNQVDKVTYFLLPP
jgi:hypothetical protein